MTENPRRDDAPEPTREQPPDERRDEDPATGPGPPGNPEADQDAVTKGKEDWSRVSGR